MNNEYKYEFKEGKNNSKSATINEDIEYHEEEESTESIRSDVDFIAMMAGIEI